VSLVWAGAIWLLGFHRAQRPLRKEGAELRVSGKVRGGGRVQSWGAPRQSREAPGHDFNSWNPERCPVGSHAGWASMGGLLRG
jgi:hypothetical protein